MLLTGNRNQCQGCKQYFNSNYAFDMHRRGEYGVDRRCLTPDELFAKGMAINDAGFWTSRPYNPNIKRGNDGEEN